MSHPYDKEAIIMGLTAVKALAESIRGSTVIDAASIFAQVNFWSDQLTAALRKRDKERAAFCKAKGEECLALLYLVV